MFVPFDLFDPPREARPTISPAILVGALALVAIVVGLVAFVAVRILG